MIHNCFFFLFSLLLLPLLFQSISTDAATFQGSPNSTCAIVSSPVSLTAGGDSCLTTTQIITGQTVSYTLNCYQNNTVSFKLYVSDECPATPFLTVVGESGACLPVYDNLAEQYSGFAILDCSSSAGTYHGMSVFILHFIYMLSFAVYQM